MLSLFETVKKLLKNQPVEQNGEFPFPYSWNFISQYSFSRNPKYRFFLFQYADFPLCNLKFSWSKAEDGKTRRPGPLSSKANKQRSRNSRFSPAQRFDKESSIITSSKFNQWKHMKRIKAIGCTKRDSLAPMARTPSKCWGTCRCARCISRCVWLLPLRYEGARGAMHHRSIWSQEMWRTKECAIAHSKTRAACLGPTEHNSTRCGESLDCSDD